MNKHGQVTGEIEVEVLTRPWHGINLAAGMQGEGRMEVIDRVWEKTQDGLIGAMRAVEGSAVWLVTRSGE